MADEKRVFASEGGSGRPTTRCAIDISKLSGLRAVAKDKNNLEETVVSFQRLN